MFWSLNDSHAPGLDEIAQCGIAPWNGDDHREPGGECALDGMVEARVGSDGLQDLARESCPTGTGLDDGDGVHPTPNNDGEACSMSHQWQSSNPSALDQKPDRIVRTFVTLR